MTHLLVHYRTTEYDAKVCSFPLKRGTYVSETWVLKEHMTNKLMTFERKIMRKISGPIRANDGYWRIKTNQEINYSRTLDCEHNPF